MNPNIKVKKGLTLKHFFFLALVLLFTACSEQDNDIVERSWGSMKGLEDLVGNMNDTSYSSVRSKPPRHNAYNTPVKIENYEGKFLWAEYAATWCKTCEQQASQVKKVQSLLKDQISFMTVITGQSTRYGDHGTVGSAMLWASRHRLDPQHVYAAKLWYKTIPEHRLFSPQGHTLFVHVGYLDSSQILDIIEYYRAGWETYAQTGEAASWMKF